MSIRSWKRKFYPVPASKVKERDALDHSIRKWEGLQPEALEKHGLDSIGGVLFERGTAREFEIHTGTCALCQHYLGGFNCIECPLSKLRDGQRCDCGRNNPWGHFGIRNNAKPMLRLLKKAKELS